MSEIPLGHHYADLEQQKDANTLGMWAFLVNEMMLFGGLFAAYAVYRYKYPDVFAAANRHLDLTLGTINTTILITSSLMIALAVHAAQTQKKKPLTLYFLAAMGLGLVFVGIKGIEYYKEFQEHLIPGAAFQFTEANPAHAQLFFVLYFFLTGAHLVHMLIGLGVMAYMLYGAWRGRYSSGNYLPVEMFGLYWHFVDVIWIFIFPLLYLIDRT